MRREDSCLVFGSMPPQNSKTKYYAYACRSAFSLDFFRSTRITNTFILLMLVLWASSLPLCLCLCDDACVIQSTLSQRPHIFVSSSNRRLKSAFEYYIVEFILHNV